LDWLNWSTHAQRTKRKNPLGLIAPAGQCLDDFLLPGSTRFSRHNRRMVMMVMAMM
jgi:hypothetical protein